MPGEVDEILESIIAFQSAHDDHELRLFKSLVSADQYRKRYYKVAEYVAPGSRVLDWGCGPGHFSFGLSKLGYQTSGYGFFEFALLSKMPESYEFTLGSVDDPVGLPYPDGSFDAVVSMGVLEHVRETGGNELASLQEIVRILRPGGHFLCFHFPNRLSAIEQLNVRMGRYHHHIYKYDSSDIRQLCRDGGLNLLEIKRYGVLPRNAWNKLPPKLRNSRFLAACYNLADDLLAIPFSLICQNYMFVARKE
jgi:SAM-dependent methyltransferase